MARKKSLEELSRENEKLRGEIDEWKEIFDAINDAITIHDDNFHVLRSNKAAEAMLGLSSGQMLGRKCFNIYHGLQAPPEECPSCRTVRSGLPIATEMYEPHLSRHVEIKALPLKDKSGNVARVVHIFSDVTERKRLLMQLMHAQKMEVIGQFAGGVAHEFNNILNVIINCVDLVKMGLENNKDPEGLREFVDIILESSHQGTELIRRLLAFSRRQVVKPEPVDMNGLVRKFRALAENTINEDIDLKMDLATEELPVMIDRVQMEQILLNLVDNARDAMPDGGTLTITTERGEIGDDFIRRHRYGVKGEYAVIGFSDTGVGMDERAQERIFEPFYTTKGEGRGRGLGLAVAYGAIKHFQGYINVWSAPGRGTTFKIYIPLLCTRVREEAGKSAAVRGGTETILVADNNEMERKVTAKILKEFGYGVIETNCEGSGLRHLRDNRDRIQLVVADMMRSRRSRQEMLEEIKKVRPDMQIIFISNYSDIREDVEGAALLPKPFHPGDLLRKVRELLDKNEPLNDCYST